MQQLLFGKNARDKVKAGIDKAVNMIKVTLGYKGRNVLIKRSYNSPGYGLQYLPASYTKDGVTVANHIELPEAIENAGCDLVKEACRKTVLQAGDSTTGCAVLLQAIVEKGLELVDAGANPMEIKEGIDEGVKYVVGQLREMAIPVVDDIERIRQIATISANNDTVLGNLISDAFAKIGKEGIIDIEQSKTSITEIKMTDGIKINKGWISPYFINNSAKHEAELIEPYILLYDKKISHLESPSVNIDAIGNLIGQIQNADASILIICPDMDGVALAGLAMNTYAGKIKCCVIQCPEIGSLQMEAMEDLAILTGAEYISTEKGTSLNKASVKMLGRADKVIVGQQSTVIISPKGNKEELQVLLGKLREGAKDVDIEASEKIEKRIAKLTGSAAVLYVGAPTEAEMKEKADRCEDAYKAVKAAIAEGGIAGGGIAFLRISQHQPSFSGTPDEERGFTILLQSIQSPFKQLCVNAGLDVNKMLSEILLLKGNVGYNGKTGKAEDLIESGVIDPVKALRCALENAASAAGAVITSEGLIV